MTQAVLELKNVVYKTIQQLLSSVFTAHWEKNVRSHVLNTFNFTLKTLLYPTICLDCGLMRECEFVTAIS